MRAWVLNLDADRELAHPEGFNPRPKDLARAEAHHDALAALVGDHRVVRPTDRQGSARGHEGICWCPTPWALAQLERVGAEPPPAPPLPVLQRVNHRAFCAALGPTLPGAVFTRSSAEALTVVSRPTPTGSWLVKHPFSFSGSGQLPIYGDRLTDGERERIERTIQKDGLQIEPRVERLADFAIHGEVVAGGDLRIGRPVIQTVTPRGTWQRSTVAGPEDLSTEERDALLAEGERVGEALRRAGYFGPFGVDAFRYRWWDDQARFNPRCEINARYTMGWAQGMSQAR
ncbi:MAG: hypothetical protein RIF41_09440, partial [Polyangiaceae bacterium]